MSTLLIQLVLLAEVKNELSCLIERQAHLSVISDKVLVRIEDYLLSESFVDFECAFHLELNGFVITENLADGSEESRLFLFFFFLKLFDLEGLNSVRKLHINYSVDALTPQFIVLPNGILIEQRAEVDPSSILKDVQVDSSIKHTMNFTQALFRLLLNLSDHRSAHTSKCVEAIILHLAWLVKGSHEVGDDCANLGQTHRFDQVLPLIGSDLRPSNLDEQLIQKLSNFLLWREHTFLLAVFVDFRTRLF